MCRHSEEENTFSVRPARRQLMDLQLKATFLSSCAHWKKAIERMMGFFKNKVLIQDEYFINKKSDFILFKKAQTNIC